MLYARTTTFGLNGSSKDEIAGVIGGDLLKNSETFEVERAVYSSESILFVPCGFFQEGQKVAKGWIWGDSL